MMRFVASGAYIAGASFASSIDATTILVVCGAIVWAVATWRRDSRDVLRRQNADLDDRNRTLEDERLRARQELSRLAALPDLEKVYGLLERHDRDARERGERISGTLAETARQLGASAALLQALVDARRPLIDMSKETQ